MSRGYRRRCPHCGERQEAMIGIRVGRGQPAQEQAIWDCAYCQKVDTRDQPFSQTRRKKLAAMFRRLAREAEKQGNPNWLLQVQHQIEQLEE